MRDINAVADRIRNRTNLSKQASLRVARSLEALAESVDWAKSLKHQNAIEQLTEIAKSRQEARKNALQQVKAARQARQKALGALRENAQRIRIAEFQHALEGALGKEQSRVAASQEALRQALSGIRAERDGLRALGESRRAVRMAALRKAMARTASADAKHAKAAKKALEQALAARKARHEAFRVLQKKRRAIRMATLRKTLANAASAEAKYAKMTKKTLQEVIAARQKEEPLLKALEERKRARRLANLRKALVRVATVEERNANAARKALEQSARASKANVARRHR